MRFSLSLSLVLSALSTAMAQDAPYLGRCGFVYTYVIEGMIHGTTHVECSPVDANGVESDLAYMLEMPEVISSDPVNKVKLERRTLFVSIDGGFATGANLIVPEGSDILVVDPPEGFDLTPPASFGVKSLLVLRVTCRDSAPDFMASEAHLGVFNQFGVSVKSQMEACSHGSLRIGPAQLGQQGGNGVLEVYLDTPASGATPRSLINAASEVVTAQMGVTSMKELADHFIYCLPDGTGIMWASCGGQSHYWSAHNDRWCLSHGGMMRELGHNFGLADAYHNGDPNMDFTTYNAFSGRIPGRPKRCFNGGEAVKLGWIGNGIKELDINDPPELVKLVAAVDHEQIRRGDNGAYHHHILARIGDVTLSYNKAAGFNSGSGASRDKLMVVQDVTPGASTRTIVGLDDSETPMLEMNPFFDSQLIIEVCCKLPNNPERLVPEHYIVSVGSYSKCFEITNCMALM